MEDNPLATSELHELERAECLHLLARGAVGRVAFTDGALPAVQPVAYHLDDEEVVFRTKNGSKLAAATRHAVVGFEVDDFDLEARTGWSVLGVGEAYEIVDPARLAALADTIPTRGCRVPCPHDRDPTTACHRSPPRRRFLDD